MLKLKLNLIFPLALNVQGIAPMFNPVNPINPVPLLMGDKGVDMTHIYNYSLQSILQYYRLLSFIHISFNEVQCEFTLNVSYTKSTEHS